MRTFNFLILALSLIAVIGTQDVRTYQLRGRVIDESGRPIAGAAVFLDPLKEEDQVFGVTTERDGSFSIKESATIRRPRRQLYIAGPFPDNSVELVSPPFNLLPNLTNRCFLGVNVTLKENVEVSVGDIIPQVLYHRVVVYLKDEKESPLITTGDRWRGLWLRLIDSSGRVVLKTTLSPRDIERAVTLGESSVAIAFPQGDWSIEASLNSPEGPWLIAPNGSRVGVTTSSITLKPSATEDK